MDADEHRGSRARAELDSLRERIEMKPDGDALSQPYPLERRADLSLIHISEPTRP